MSMVGLLIALLSTQLQQRKIRDKTFASPLKHLRQERQYRYFMFDIKCKQQEYTYQLTYLAVLRS